MIGLVLPASGLTVDQVRQTHAMVRHLIAVVVVVHNDPKLANARDDICTGQPSDYVEYIHFDCRLGKTEAVLEGIRCLLANPSITAIAQIDGRHKQPPVDLTLLAEGLKSGSLDMCVANRYGLRGDLASHGHRRSSIQLWSQLTFHATRFRLTDTVSGMRIYSRRLADAFTQEIRCFGYGLEAAQLIVARSLSAKVGEVPVRSSKQASSTSAEKLEDNLAVLLGPGSEFTRAQRVLALSMMAEIKLRNSFVFDGSVFDVPVRYRFTYTPYGEDSEASYSVHGDV
jgi:hypothetical protein